MVVDKSSEEEDAEDNVEDNFSKKMSDEEPSDQNF